MHILFFFLCSSNLQPWLVGWFLFLDLTLNLILLHLQQCLTHNNHTIQANLMHSSKGPIQIYSTWCSNCAISIGNNVNGAPWNWATQRLHAIYWAGQKVCSLPERTFWPTQYFAAEQTNEWMNAILVGHTLASLLEHPRFSFPLPCL